MITRVTGDAEPLALCQHGWVLRYALHSPMHPLFRQNAANREVRERELTSRLKVWAYGSRVTPQPKCIDATTSRNLGIRGAGAVGPPSARGGWRRKWPLSRPEAEPRGPR